MKTTSHAIVCLFPNVQPINSVGTGISRGHYTDHYDFITNGTVPLHTVKGAKNLYLVCPNRTIGETEYVELLRAVGKQPCRNAPQYLLGLMAKVPESEMPAELRNKKLVAAEPDNTSSVFVGKYGDPCFLGVDRGVGYRKLSFTKVGGGWAGPWVFLAEDFVH